jgi:primosomal protein N' (replication factor Y)
MNIINVIPIARGVGKETLSYFSAVDVPPGSIIKVPLRNRQIPALAISQEPISDIKSEIKNSGFMLKKIGKVKPVSLFLPEFIEASHEAGRYFAGSTGSVLSSITPTPLFEFSDKVEVGIKAEIKKNTSDNLAPYTLQAAEEERFAHYKSLIREQFARKKSLFFCLPTIQDTKRVFETITKGIEDYTYVLNSSLSKKELVTTWNKIITDKHPVLIIATGSFLCIPRHDIGTIILERESSSGYKTQTRPYVDIRTFVKMYAKKIQAKLIYGDLLLRTETLWLTNNGDYTELAPLKFRSISTSGTQVIDMKKYKTLDTPEFRILSEELENLVKHSKENNENMFIFAARRGLSPLTVCGDCGTTVLCTRCSAPIVLHKTRNENFFLCHRCGERRSAEERCKNCSSWKLTTLGIGIELIEQVIKEMFPDIKLFRLDKDSVKTHKQALAAMSQFYNAPGSILIGTEMALAYLEKPVENSAVASIDSLFSIPDFRINEKIMNILLKMRSFTQKTFIVQTRSRDQHIFDYATKGNLMDFYREEIEARKKLSYPPFTTLIKITVKGNRDRVLSDMKFIESVLADYNPLVFPAFIETINKKTVMHALVKVKHTEWVAPALLEKLLALPPHIAINVDPESLL